MKNLLTTSTILSIVALFLLGGFFVVPADAQSANIKEKCTLSDNIDIKINVSGSALISAITSIKKGSVISPNIDIPDDNVKIKLISGGGVASSDFENLTDLKAKKAIENKWGLICLANTINGVSGWIFFILASVAFVLILIAGFLWMTAGANADNQKKAAAMIGAALVGIVIAILARIIPGIVIGILS